MSERPSARVTSIGLPTFDERVTANVSGEKCG